MSRSGLLHSVLLSLGVAGAFIVAGSWIRASPLYHLFVGTALICGGVLLAWWRKIQRLHVVLRAAAVMVYVAATILVLYGVTLAWPRILVYGGEGDLEG